MQIYFIRRMTEEGRGCRAIVLILDYEKHNSPTATYVKKIKGVCHL